MARNCEMVYLAFEDEDIGEKCSKQLNFSGNKIGGTPDWPPKVSFDRYKNCPLCSIPRLLIVQCYAPIENSIYHRTLYLFACINPNCWNQSESWSCYRSQAQDASDVSNDATTVNVPPETTLSWCSNADEWGEDDDTANGNVISVDNKPDDMIRGNSDEDDESNSTEMETVEQALGDMHVYDTHNANMLPRDAGAVGAMGGQSADAELEGGDEPELVSVETPDVPQVDLQALLQQSDELPPDIRSRLASGQLYFNPKFMYVTEEKRKQKYTDEKVLELINKYTKDNELDLNSPVGNGSNAGADEEQYEESTPLHGDRLFHNFVTRLQENPGQILRYSRNAPPLLGAPLLSPSPSNKCQRCNSPLICEMQLLPAFAQALSLPNATLPHLHFLSVLVFTCVQSCWETGDSVIEERVVVQPEV